MIESPAGSALDGTLRFIRYAFMPNRLRYCGGDDNRTLLEYGAARVTDSGLTPLLEQFSGALPYLRLTARANGIADPFDARVVEAYWIGSPLLDNVSVRLLYDALLERVGRHLHGRARDLVLSKAPEGALPHHSFHVLDVYSRIGDQGNSLEMLDGCRVSWGRVVEVIGDGLTVERAPLHLRDGRLALSDPRRERVIRQVDGKGFATEVEIGDWVSVHWGWACEVLTDSQRGHLEHYTKHHLAIANRTI